MKIDRVILSTNNNRTYYEFWNPLSKLYKENFGITPTLIFLGSENELNSLSLSDEYGTIIRQDIVDTVDFAWATTWALFYYTKYFPNEVCLINGIDQIPLGSKFIIDFIKDVEDESYLMLIDDAYKLSRDTKILSRSNNFYPSAYHIAKGSTFSEMYEFENDFQSEIKKIEDLKMKTLWDTTWGLDEAYSSKVLIDNVKNMNIVKLSKFGEILNGGRVECHRYMEIPYDINNLRNNGYIECHACRPFSEHSDYLNKMINNVPKFI